MSVRFDAATDRLSRAADLFDYNAPYAWMAWVYLVSDLNAIATLLSANNATGSNQDTIRTGADGTTIETRVSVASASTSAAGPSLTVGQWYHVALVRESVTSLKLYVDGVLVSTNTRDVTGRTAVLLIEHGVLLTSSSPSDSRVDRIKAWSAALTIAEVQAEMWSIRPQRTDNLYGFWPTWTGADRITDYSGNGRDWTASGTLTDEDPAPVSWGAQSTRIIYPLSATYTDTGTAISVLSGSGADAAILLDIGSAVSVFTGSGADAPTYSDTGAGLAALFGAGADVAILVDVGGGVLIAIGSGTDDMPPPPTDADYIGDATIYDLSSPTGSIANGTVLDSEYIYDT